ncbi:anthranilate synthase family protein [Streptomonospora salina]|uniref:anthranilate synthase n=1 Tax=Streptomonospora salina TaxID=104205 RepID=A0A841EFB2_9ACTN|nr:anthranilate synthase family protein [Streptomonospora salina]MBB6000019.1 phenazine biosynthesis protein phzE [Streptomonospora salina]
MSAQPVEFLERLLSEPELPPFAVLHRAESPLPGTVDVLVGEMSTVETLSEVPLARSSKGNGTGVTHDVLLLVPYRQLVERGFTAPDDGTPLVAMNITDQASVPLKDVFQRVPSASVSFTGGEFDTTDEEYAELVRQIMSEEIGTGEGSNFVIRRSFRADISDYSPRTALSLFRLLLEQEANAYWTFVVHTGTHTLVGATPERHISVDAGTAVMNPISGTYSYPPGGPTLRGVTDFLADTKESDELYMVLDEELKIMSRVCPDGGFVLGPYLKRMSRVAHTEYFIEGKTNRDVREILRETMFAPTVVGSPLENATRVIAQYEPDGRGYYSGIAALIGHDARGNRALDSALLIRTAQIAPEGQMRLDVGATLVRHSVPDSEVGETRAKAAGLLAAFTEKDDVPLDDHPEIRAALAARNTRIGDFWLRAPSTRRDQQDDLIGLRALIIDAEDTFTSMMAQQISSLGLEIDVRRFDEAYAFDSHDVVVMGPGPGDPRDLDDPRIARLHRDIGALLAERRPFVAVCLSHQVLSLCLGLELTRRETPNQGVQREIELFGERHSVGFYNTYVALSKEDKLLSDDSGPVQVSRNTDSDEVFALRGDHFSSMQFHAESVFTRNGPLITAAAIRQAMGR